MWWSKSDTSQTPINIFNSGNFTLLSWRISICLAFLNFIVAACLKNVPRAPRSSEPGIVLPSFKRCLTKGLTFHLQVPHSGIGTVHIMTFVQRHKVSAFSTLCLCGHAAGRMVMCGHNGDLRLSTTVVYSCQIVERVDRVEEKGEFNLKNTKHLELCYFKLV